MRRKTPDWLRFAGYFLAVCSGIVASLFLYLYLCGRMDEPAIPDQSLLSLVPSGDGNDFRTIGQNWIRKSESGLREMYVEGGAFERGLINGKLARNLIHEQEAAFSEQIEKLVPSAFYRRFLKYFIGWFNRDLEEHVTDEYKSEIYGVALAATSEFNYIGTPYQRLMNYHAAHDIGHALQNLALVGCTSFATWDSASVSGHGPGGLIVGRNFDFYVGDRFAQNKIVQFVRPDTGIPFMMVTWGGMIGTVSGMNLEGLTITLNAAKSEVPSGSATPISLLAREVIQYASDIDEAVAIARKRRVFVSESFLVGSAKDGKAVSIEITPDTVAVFDAPGNRLVCANHYQSDGLVKSPLNQEQMEQSSSVYRQQRMNQLLDEAGVLTPEKTALILRDTRGLSNASIGLGNEKAVNQLISHHAIIFEPESRRAWVSTAPWNLGRFMCYQLDSVFALGGLTQDREIADTLHSIPADPFLETDGFRNFMKFRELRTASADGKEIDPEEIVNANPDYYFAYVIAGDQLFRKKDFAKAEQFYRQALTKEIATVPEAEYIRAQIVACDNRR
jgi:hypothetical protein